MESNRFAVTAIGADKPGIVAAVTAALVEHDCNLEDTEMAVLGGHFAMMLIVGAPEGTDSEALQLDLSQAGGQLGVDVVVRPIAGGTETGDGGELWTLSVYGADHPGIVAGIAAVLADRRLSITDLRSRLVGPDAAPVFVMFLDVEVPSGHDIDELHAAVAAAASDLGVEASLHPGDAAIF